MRSTRLLGVVGALTILAAACSSEGAPPAVVAAAPHLLSETAGVIATAGNDGLHLLLADASDVATPDVGDIVTQPTWSRDGSRLVTSTQSQGVWSVIVVDGATGDVISSSEAIRPYFFFSWSSDGSRIAALGPGPGGTTLDVLDASGSLVEGSVVGGGSVYVSWQPDGTDLLVHSDDSLSLIRSDLTVEPLGDVGRFFLAPSWIPGTRDVLLVAALPLAPHLVRFSIDGRSTDPSSAPVDDLGTTQGVASVVVDPSGGLAALLHANPGSAPSQGDTITTSYTSGARDSVLAAAVDRPDQAPTAAVEMVDLANGNRTPITNQAPLWGEWSPDGRNLLIGSFDPTTSQGVWSSWDGRVLTELTGFLPTTSFLQRYLLFADQYVEQPRLWAPDGSAFTYAARNADNSDAVYVMSLDPADSPAEIDAAAVGFWSPG